MPGFTVPKNADDLKQIISSNKYVVIDFTATWCGPCRMITPILERLSVQYDNVVFVKVDVDEFSDIAQEYSVRAMPTLFFLNDGIKVSDIVGANPGAIENNLANLVA
ncbi:hypothetical protein G6F37_012028 [Rhizopus arrhizus]|nr:hypothetical protein G6F38_006912 [Rhizopus arrhizus]KAG1146114.1 hypothetical protein G6F37_012028 [Rhizopus arrhizus]